MPKKDLSDVDAKLESNPELMLDCGRRCDEDEEAKKAEKSSPRGLEAAGGIDGCTGVESSADVAGAGVTAEGGTPRDPGGGGKDDKNC